MLCGETAAAAKRSGLNAIRAFYGRSQQETAPKDGFFRGLSVRQFRLPHSSGRLCCRGSLRRLRRFVLHGRAAAADAHAGDAPVFAADADTDAGRLCVLFFHGFSPVVSGFGLARRRRGFSPTAFPPAIRRGSGRRDYGAGAVSPSRVWMMWPAIMMPNRAGR